ncbi:hypothetical protein MKZ07_14470 [Paenibacillus sp. FSL P4-0338]|uniref:hypothetical protein n=1 Tax=Paenibacillus sp. FSL P4-0338 TaxID=2921635 RepID=UPI0030FB697C
MKKRKVVTLLLGSAILLSPTNVFALSTDQTIPLVVFDTAQLQEKSFEPANTNTGAKLSAALTPHWTAKTTVTYNSGATSVSDSFTDSSKRTRLTIDRIYAKVKLYEDGGHIGSAEDDQSNLSHAGAQFGSGASASNTEAYGAHKFEHAGFQSWYPETFDT